MVNRVRVNSSQEVLSKRNDLLEAAAQGVGDVLIIQGYDSPLSSGGEETARILSNFQRAATDQARQQVNVEEFALNLVNNTSAGDATTPDYILLDRDLFAERMNFVFGCTWSTLGLSVQSIARVIAHTHDRGLQRLHTRHVARHEFAHMRGLNNPTDYTNPDQRGGIYKGHCADICTMRQSMTVQEAIEQAKQLEGHDLAGFCIGCITTLWNKRYN